MAFHLDCSLTMHEMPLHQALSFAIDSALTLLQPSSTWDEPFVTFGGGIVAYVAVPIDSIIGRFQEFGASERPWSLRAVLSRCSLHYLHYLLSSVAGCILCPFGCSAQSISVAASRVSVDLIFTTLLAPYSIVSVNCSLLV